jgi:predicted nucleotidyltransferase
MMNTFYDISAKIDQPALELIATVATVLRDMGISFFLVGARARDIVLKSIFNKDVRRMTSDYDFAICVASWDKYEEIVNCLVQTGAFQRDVHVAHRLHHDRHGWIDFVPFGPIRNPDGEVRWPPDFLTVFKTSGFQEAYDAAITVRLRAVPPLDLKVCSPAGLAILKVFAWSEGGNSAGKHAEDLSLIMPNYLDIVDPDPDIAGDDEFDYELSGARMLGRDMGNIADPDTAQRLLDVLLPETEFDGYRLAQDLMSLRAYEGDTDDFGKAKRLLQAMVQGIQDKATAT